MRGIPFTGNGAAVLNRAWPTQDAGDYERRTVGRQIDHRFGHSKAFRYFGPQGFVIDADLRNPSLHAKLGRNNSIGLSNYLSGACAPAALVNIAERRLSRSQAAKTSESPDTSHRDKNADDQASAQIRRWGELALAHDPLNARAFRILGQVAEDASDEQRAEQLMQAAVRRSPRQSMAVYWLMRKSYDNQDYAAATRYADALLRTRPQVIAQVMPILSRIAEREDAKGRTKKGSGR